MRLLALAGAFGLALAASGPFATPADASPVRHALSARMYKGGAENCGFYSFNQCLAAHLGQRRHLHDGAVPGRRHPRAYAVRLVPDPQLAHPTRQNRSPASLPGFSCSCRAELLRLLDGGDHPRAALGAAERPVLDALIGMWSISMTWPVLRSSSRSLAGSASRPWRIRRRPRAMLRPGRPAGASRRRARCVTPRLAFAASSSA